MSAKLLKDAGWIILQFDEVASQAQRRGVRAASFIIAAKAMGDSLREDAETSGAYSIQERIQMDQCIFKAAQVLKLPKKSVDEVRKREE